MRSALVEALLGSVADAIVATDREGRITFWNPGAARIFGFGAAEAVGQSLDLIIPENQRARHWQGYDTVMRTGQSRYGAGDVLAVPALTADGRRISVEFTVLLLRDAEGAVGGMAAVMRDVTERFETMKALRRQLAAQRPEVLGA
ncbi:MAG: PAS sensor domain-containing protein [Kaistia sp. SCN 65-12]|nr:MAG: PAS sensor domain-containing protein [Kaistia sp. SCN 65-12]